MSDERMPTRDQYARELLGMPPEWQVFRWEAVAHELRGEAHALARRIEGPALACVTVETRTDLRALTLLMLGWADKLEDRR